MRITPYCRTLSAQVVIAGILGAIAITFGAGLANADRGAVPPAPPHSDAGSAHWPRVGPWPGDGYGPYPYIIGPGPIDSIVEPPASTDDATWPPTGASWPPGGSSGDSSGSATPIVMPHDQPVSQDGGRLRTERSAKPSESQKPIVPVGDGS
jgi:hypothetical protein